MNTVQVRAVSPRIIKIVAAIIVGLSVGTALPPDPVNLPFVGTTPGLLVGIFGIITGAVLYLWVPNLVNTSACRCIGDCGCS